MQQVQNTTLHEFEPLKFFCYLFEHVQAQNDKANKVHILICLIMNGLKRN